MEESEPQLEPDPHHDGEQAPVDQCQDQDHRQDQAQDKHQDRDQGQDQDQDRDKDEARPPNKGYQVKDQHKE